MVDTDALAAYCEFGPERAYLLVALARPKDGPGATDAPAIRKVVADAGDLDRRVAELAHATARFDARYRLYVSANPRDLTGALFELRSATDDWLRAHLRGDDGATRKFGRVGSEWKSTLQSDGCAATTNFLFDLDDATRGDADRLRTALADHTDVHTTRATPNGFHVVAEPFDYNRLATDVDYELKTDGLLFWTFLDGED